MTEPPASEQIIVGRAQHWQCPVAVAAPRNPTPDPSIDEWHVEAVEPVAYRHLANLAQQLQSSVGRSGVSLNQSNPHGRQRKIEREIVS
jgi:hypothetical protein